MVGIPGDHRRSTSTTAHASARARSSLRCVVVIRLGYHTTPLSCGIPDRSQLSQRTYIVLKVSSDHASRVTGTGGMDGTLVIFAYITDTSTQEA